MFDTSYTCILESYTMINVNLKSIIKIYDEIRQP